MALPVYIRPLLALLVMVAVIGVATFVFRNDPSGSEPVRSLNQQPPQNIDVALKKARFSEIENGLVVWELVAEKVDYDKDGETAYLSDIRMEFHRNRLHAAITVTADSGEYFSSTKTIKLKGHIHVLTEDGASFKTTSIVYTGANEKFATNAPVTFKQQRLQLTALGLDLSVKNQRANFRSLVDATLLSK